MLVETNYSPLHIVAKYVRQPSRKFVSGGKSAEAPEANLGTYVSRAKVWANLGDLPERWSRAVRKTSQAHWE